MRLDDDPGISGVLLGPLRRRSVHVRCVDTGMVQVGDCVFHPGRTSPTNDCGRLSEVCRKTQSSSEKYVPDQNLRAVPQAHPLLLVAIGPQQSRDGSSRQI